MADKVTTSFPKVGKSVAAHVTARQPLRGKSVKRGGASGGMLEAATAAHRANIQESLGAKLRPTAQLYAPNAAESSATLRNTRIVPSKAGIGDFYMRRGYGQFS
jgi:hypothetical protein